MNMSVCIRLGSTEVSVVFGGLCVRSACPANLRDDSALDGPDDASTRRGPRRDYL